MMKKQIALVALLFLGMSCFNASAQFKKFNLGKAIQAGKDAAQAISLSDADIAAMSKEYMEWMDKHNPLTKPDSEYGKRRLQAIENFSDLGSGIHIAMQDLDIRGAGNLLGAEQSGFIADLGYETYQKILAEAVHELRNDEFAELYADEIKGEGQISGEEFVDECQIESDLELLLPATYVTGSSERMLLYRELDGLTLDKDVDAFRFRLEDRFGPVPPETQELLRIVPLRRLAARLGVEKVFLKGGRMTLFFVSNADSPFYQSQAFGKMIDYMMKYTRRCDLREQNGRRSMLIKDVTNVETAVSVLQEIVALPVKEQD